MKKADLIVIISLLTAAAISLLVSTLTVGRGSTALRVEIYSDGGLVFESLISEISEAIEIDVPSPEGGVNIIRISPFGAEVAESDCRSRDCVRAGKIMRSGELIVCLPHKLLIKLTGSGTDGEVDAVAG